MPSVSIPPSKLPAESAHSPSQDSQDTPEPKSSTESKNAPQSNTSARKLAFLNTLVAIPKERDIIFFKKCASSLNQYTALSQVNAKIVFIPFVTRLLYVCQRANYWSWAPHYGVFLLKLMKDQVIKDMEIIKTCMYAFCLLSCFMCQYDPEREPKVRNYFVKLFVQYAMYCIKTDHGEIVEAIIMAIGYVFCKVPVDKRAIKDVINLRKNDLNDFYRPGNTELRYQRALWLSCIARQLMICIKSGDENLSTNKSLLLLCNEEAIVSYKNEQIPKVKKVYEVYFEIKTEK